MTPASDEEIDELEDETDEDEEYGEPSPLSKKSGDLDAAEVPDESAVEEEIKSNDIARANSDKPKAVRRPPRRRTERHDRRIDLGLLDHKAHPDCPDTLSCLPDTNGRPQHTLPVILRCAILGSPRKRLTIREIYATMEAKYPYYKTAGQTWKVEIMILFCVWMLILDYSYFAAICPSSFIAEQTFRTTTTTCHRSWVWVILDRKSVGSSRYQETTQTRSTEQRGSHQQSCSVNERSSIGRS